MYDVVLVLKRELTKDRPMAAMSPAAIDMAVCSPSMSLESSGKELTRPV